MKNSWKWILGSIIVLVIIASVVCGHVFVGKQMVGVRNEVSSFRSFHYNPPVHMNGQSFGFDGGHGMMPGYDYPYPMIRQRPSFFRGLFPMVLLGLLVYGAYYFGTRKTERSTNSGVSTKVVEPEIVEPNEDVSEISCSKCEGVVQAGWRNCPHCGKRL